MMPTVLLRRRSPALQQHRTRTRTRSFPVTRRVRYVLLSDRAAAIFAFCCSTARSLRSRVTGPRIAAAAARRPLARGHVTVHSRMLTSRGARLRRATRLPPQDRRVSRAHPRRGSKRARARVYSKLQKKKFIKKQKTKKPLYSTDRCFFRVFLSGKISRTR